MDLYKKLPFLVTEHTMLSSIPILKECTYNLPKRTSTSNSLLCNQFINLGLQIIPIVNHPSIFLKGYKIEFWERLPSKGVSSNHLCPPELHLFPKPTLKLVLSLKATQPTFILYHHTKHTISQARRSLRVCYAAYWQWFLILYCKSCLIFRFRCFCILTPKKEKVVASAHWQVNLAPKNEYNHDKNLTYGC